MSFLEQAQKAVETGETHEQWVYNRSTKLMVELNLGSGVRLDVTYYTQHDTDPDNIERAVLHEHGDETVLDNEDIQLLISLEIL